VRLFLAFVLVPIAFVALVLLKVVLLGVVGVRRVVLVVESPVCVAGDGFPLIRWLVLEQIEVDLEGMSTVSALLARRLVVRLPLLGVVEIADVDVGQVGFVLIVVDLADALEVGGGHVDFVSALFGAALELLRVLEGVPRGLLVVLVEHLAPQTLLGLCLQFARGDFLRVSVFVVLFAIVSGGLWVVGQLGDLAQEAGGK